MKTVELYAQVRYAVQIQGLSHREAARRFGIDPKTVAKMMRFSVPPGDRRTKPAVKPKLDPFIGIIEKILADDKDRPKKQQHTSKRIFERLRDEHGYSGGLTIVKDYVAGSRQRSREMFVPLVNPPGHAQADFGEAHAVIAGVERKIHFFAFDLPHSDACFVIAYPAETAEAFCDGHVKAFEFFGGVPRSILYDNTRIAIARIPGDGTRQRTRAFSELQSHYLFQDRFGRPGKGNDKGKVEGLVGFVRRNFMVPVPAFDSFEAFNADLLERCRKRFNDRLRGHSETIGGRLERDLVALRNPLPPPYDACEKVPTSVSSLSSAFSRWRSSVVRPARVPWSRSACFTQFDSVCAVQPILAAIEAMAAHCDACSVRCSNTIRTARSRTSGENFGDFDSLVMAPLSQELEPPANPGRFSPSVDEFICRGARAIED